MIKVHQEKWVTTKLTKKTAKKVTIEYLQKYILGEDCYVTEDGKLESWTSWPHGSGTTTTIGDATELQKRAFALITEMNSSK